MKVLAICGHPIKNSHLNLARIHNPLAHITMKITGFLSKKKINGKDKWSRTSKPVVMIEEGQNYVIAVMEQVIDVKSKKIADPKPKYIKGTKAQLMKVAIGFEVV